MTDVIMPKMGDGMEEGTLLEWLKKEGEKVKSGEIIGTIQTDKATLELEAPGSGVLSGFLIQPGTTVPVGKPIAAILKEGEKLPGDWGSGNGSGSNEPVALEAPKPAGPEVQAPANAPVTAQQEATGNPSIPSTSSAEVGAPIGDIATPANGAAGSRVKASPLARKVAQELGIDLAAVKGSGPGGRVVEKDVRSARVASAPVASAAEFAPVAADQVVQLNRLRQITAQRTAQSKQQVPHFYVTVEVDVERIMELRRMFEEEDSGKVSVNDFVIKACALALRDMPEVNAAFQNPTTVTRLGGVHVGMAVATGEGLTVAVVKNADQMSLRQISAKSKDLAKRANENKLTLDELSGSTFSVSNMGMLDVDNFLAIINQPNSAILAVATARKKVVANEDDEIEIRHHMNITCSFDHRVVDGAVGARFINVVRGYLEKPTKLVG